MRAVLFKKVVIKSITLLFSVLVWGQPALGCDGSQRDRTCDLRPEIEKVYGGRNVPRPAKSGIGGVKGHNVK